MKLLRKLYVFIAVAVVFSSLSMLSFAKEKEEVPAESITLDLKKAVIGEGQKLRLHATLSPSDSTDKITWTSKDPSVATVSKKGLVKAVGVGRTTIKAVTASGQKAKFIIRVKAAPEKVTLNIKGKRLTAGDQFQLKAKVPKGSFYDIKWKSSDPKIAKVSKDGLVTAKRPGTVRIWAKSYNGVKAKCKIVVRPKVEDISLDDSEISLKNGTKHKIHVTFYPEKSKENVVWYSSDESVVKVSRGGTLKAVGIGSAIITAETEFTHIVKTCEVRVWEKQIALTFDDGPNRNTTPTLLDGLDELGAKCTFFLVGQCVASNNYDIVERMHDAGHEIGNHTWDHAKLTTLSNAAISNEIEKTNNVIYEACGAYPTLFRSPYGAYNQTILGICHLPHIFWSVDTNDWRKPGQSVVTQRIVDGARDGAIILCHDIHADTIPAALNAIRILQDEGYEFVTVTELLSRDGTPPEAGVTYYNGY